MPKLSLPFTTEYITLATPEELSPEIKSELEQFCKFIPNMLSYRWYNSEIYRFNQSPVGAELELTPLTFRYLRNLLNAAKITSGKLALFDSSWENINFDAATETVVKLAEIKVSSNLMIKAFCFGELENLLQQFGLANYLLYTETIYLTRGKRNWEIDLEISAAENKYSLLLEDQIMLNAPWNKTANSSPFSDGRWENQPQHLVVEGKRIMPTAIAFNLAQRAGISDFRHISENWLVGISLIYKDGKVEQISM